MKILHLCLTGPYTDGFNYQENMLTKYQAKAGIDVSIIASQWEWSGGSVKKNEGPNQYINKDGVKVFRLPIKREKTVFYRYKRYVGFYETLEKIKPDIIFIHNLQFLDLHMIKKYACNHAVKIYADNHADFSNSARTKLAIMFYKIVWRTIAKRIEPYVTKFYGVLPARVDFLKNIYGLPSEKCELLVMGADDKEVSEAKDPKVIKNTKMELGFEEDDFIIVTGGKIDRWKKQTLLLMKAVTEIRDKNVKLLVFGPVEDEIKLEFEKMLCDDRIKHVDWADTRQSYRYFAIANLVVFPGRHSVYWEQVAGIGIPMLCKYWKGTTHIDLGGNVEFFMNDSEEEIRQKIEELIVRPEIYNDMRNVAEKEGIKKFSYKMIAEKIIT